MNNASERRLPLWQNIILCIFICSLALHFFTDSLGPATPMAAMELLELGDHDNCSHVDCEDDLVIPVSFINENPQSLLRIALPDADILLSVLSAPVPPPPEAI